MSRIGDIRNVIVGLGGRSDITYYADGASYGGFGPKTGVNYKVEKWSDGLTHELREEAVKILAKLPGVDKAWLSRPVHMPYYYRGAGVVGHHIKVHYTHKAVR